MQITATNTLSTLVHERISYLSTYRHGVKILRLGGSTQNRTWSSEITGGPGTIYITLAGYCKYRLYIAPASCGNYRLYIAPASCGKYMLYIAPTSCGNYRLYIAPASCNYRLYIAPASCGNYRLW
jgi:hypothetical protein